MVVCSHESCGKENRVWLHTGAHPWTDVKMHLWCISCGLVKNISDDRPHKLGYWINILSHVANRFSLKQVQKRCIARELASNEYFNDIYGATGSAQKELFKEIVIKYCNINENTIDSFIY